MATMVERKCARCGNAFKARKADVDRGWARFCSKSCKAKKQAASHVRKRPQMQKWERDELQHEEDLFESTSGWDEGGWLSDDSGVTPR